MRNPTWARFARPRAVRPISAAVPRAGGHDARDNVGGPASKHIRVTIMVLMVCVMLGIFAVDSHAEVDPYEPDDSLAEAKQISTDGVAQGRWFEGRTVSYDGVDWLWFEARAGMTYRLTVSRGTVWSLPAPTFHTADGTYVEDETGYGVRDNVLFYATADGPVYVQLKQNSYMETGSYQVSVLEGTGSTFGLEDEYEPDNSLRSARDLSTDGTVQHRVSSSVDLVRIRVTAGKVYRIDARLEIETGYVLCSLETSGGSEILGRELVWKDAGYRYFIAPRTEELYIRLASGTGLDGTPYALEVTELELSTLAGTVRRATDATPFSGARVAVYSADSGGFIKGPWCETTTDTEGSWSVRVLPGHYVALFEDPESVLLPEYFGGGIPPPHAPTPIPVGEEARYAPTPIPVGEEVSVRGIDARLWTPCSIEGTASVETTPVPGSTLLLTRSGDWVPFRSTTTDVDGHFGFAALDPRFTYTLEASPSQGYIAIGPVGVSPTTGQVSRVDIPMALPGSISGTVTDGSLGGPLQGIVVNVWRAVSGDQLSPSAVTDEEGRYLISGLPTGNYRLMFTDPAGQTGPYGRIWNGTSQYAWDDPIPVVIRENTPGVDVTFYDRLPPITTHGVYEGWQHGPVEIAFSAVDQGWMGARTWVVDPGAGRAREYAGPFLHTAEGAYTYRYWSEDGEAVDGSRNVEETRAVTVRVDNTPPVTRVGAQIDGATLRAPAVVEIGAVDPLSGLKVIHWSANGKTGSGPLVRLNEPGEYQLTFFAEDMVGNVEATQSVSFRVAEREGSLSGLDSEVPIAPSYRLDLGWPLQGGPGTTPSYDEPVAVAYDATRRRAYVARLYSESVETLGWNGALESQLSAPHIYHHPVGVGVTNQGLVCGVWRASVIAVWGSDGTVLWHRSLHDFYTAADIASDGRVWVAFQPPLSSTTQIFRFSSPDDSPDYVRIDCGLADMAFAPTGELFVAAGDGTVRMLGATEEAPEVRRWSLPGSPFGIEVDPDGYVYVSLESSVRKYTSTGQLVDEFPAPAPRRLACDAEGNVYVVSATQKNVLRYVHGLRSTAVSVTSALAVATRESSVSGVALPSIGGLPVRLDFSSDGQQWSTLTRGLTVPGGYYELTAIPPSAGYVRVVAGGDSTFAGSASAPAVVAVPTVASATVGNSLLSYGQTTMLQTTVRTHTGQAVVGEKITLEMYSSSSGSWRSVATAITDGGGRCSIRLAPHTNSRYRVRYAGSPNLASCTSAETEVRVRARTGRPTISPVVRAGRPVRVYGSLDPWHAPSAFMVKLYFYQYRSGHWTLVKTASAAGKSTYGRTQYSAYVTLPRSGKWRVRALHGDSGHVASYSAYTYFAVW